MLGSPAGGTVLKGCGRVGRYALLEEVEDAEEKAIFPEVIKGPPPQPPSLLFLCNGVENSPGVRLPHHDALPHHRPRIDGVKDCGLNPLKPSAKFIHSCFPLIVSRVLVTATQT